MCLQNVREWLVMLTMEHYLDVFLDHGYLTLERCKMIICSDLIMLGIDEPSHRKLILDGVQLLQNYPDFLSSREPRHLHVWEEDLEYRSLLYGFASSY